MTDQILDRSFNQRHELFQSSHPLLRCYIHRVHDLHAAASVEAAADAALLHPGGLTADLGCTAKTQVFTNRVIRSMRVKEFASIRASRHTARVSHSHPC